MTSTIRGNYHSRKEVDNMKLKVTTTGEEIKSQKEENIKRGKRAKRKGGQYERDIAKKNSEPRRFLK